MASTGRADITSRGDEINLLFLMIVLVDKWRLIQYGTDSEVIGRSEDPPSAECSIILQGEFFMKLLAKLILISAC
jgi:hypothetical protein